MSTPLAYFITFRTYGTWLHGDIRGSFQGRAGGSPSALAPMPRLERAMEERLSGSPVRLDAGRRIVVAETIHEVCQHRSWTLHTVAVQVEHVHVLTSSNTARVPPERIMGAFKAWSTRRLVERGMLSGGTKVWSRHGSTRYVWTAREMDLVRHYVEHH